MIFFNHEVILKSDEKKIICFLHLIPSWNKVSFSKCVSVYSGKTKLRSNQGGRLFTCQEFSETAQEHSGRNRLGFIILMIMWDLFFFCIVNVIKSLFYFIFAVLGICMYAHPRVPLYSPIQTSGKAGINTGYLSLFLSPPYAFWDQVSKGTCSLLLRWIEQPPNL